MVAMGASYPTSSCGRIRNRSTHTIGAHTMMSIPEMVIRVAISTATVVGVLWVTTIPEKLITASRKYQDNQYIIQEQKRMFELNGRAACDRVADTTAMFVLEYDKYICARWNETYARKNK